MRIITDKSERKVEDYDLWCQCARIWQAALVAMQSTPSPHFVFFNLDVWKSCWGDLRELVSTHRMTGRRRVRMSTTARIMPKLIKIDPKDFPVSKEFKELINLPATSEAERDCSLAWLIAVIWPWKICKSIEKSEWLHMSWRWAWTWEHVPFEK